MNVPARAIATYKVDYANGATQVRHLVDHEHFVAVDSLTRVLEAHSIGRELSGLEVKMLQDLKQYKKEAFGDSYFTDQSPLYEAITTRWLLLPEHQGGKQPVTLTSQ